MENSQSDFKPFDLFIGSSSEAIPIALLIKEIINEEFTSSIIPVIWNEYFDKNPSMSFLGVLQKATVDCKFSIFILTKDDKVEIRGKSKYATRTNVFFEAGLFIGENGNENVAFVYNRSEYNDLDFISDLTGFNTSPFDADVTLYNTLYNIGKEKKFAFKKENFIEIHDNVKNSIKSQIIDLCNSFKERNLKNSEPLKNATLIVGTDECFEAGIRLVNDSKNILLSSIVLKNSLEPNKNENEKKLLKAYKEKLQELNSYFVFKRLFNKTDPEIQKQKNELSNFLLSIKDKTIIANLNDTIKINEMEFIISDFKVLLVFPDYTKNNLNSVVGFGILFENASIIPMIKCWYNQLIYSEK